MSKKSSLNQSKEHETFGKKSKYILLILFILSASLPFFFNKQKEYVVTLSDTGFSPAVITVPRGAKVTWEAQGKNLHWPASDIHPTHGSYPEGGGCIGSKLDACKGLKNGETYSFEFDRVGNWGIHDHAAAQSTMVVKVLDNPKNNILQKINSFFAFSNKSEKLTDSRDKKHLQLFSEKQKEALSTLFISDTPDKEALRVYEICLDLKGSKFREIQHCYSEVFYFIAKNKDQKFAFNTINSLLSNPLNKVKACHLMAHGVGNGIYDKNPGDWQNAIGKASSECSYGEIHGILEGYSSSGTNPFEKQKITEICAKNHDPACYHGLGHVLIVQMGNDLKKAADLCYVLSDKGASDNCQKGVFMENMIGQSLEDHGLITAERRKFFYNHLDEFKTLCESQTNPDFIRACWTETIHASVTKFHGDAQKVFEFCALAQTPDAAMGCRLHSLAELVPRNNFDPFKAQYMCKIPIINEPNFERDCYNMIVSVIMANSPSKINEISKFCAYLGPEFESQCNYMAKRQVVLLRTQDPQKADSLCSGVEVKSVEICSKD